MPIHTLFPDTKARIMYEKCPQANIKAAIGFYETGYDGIATVYLVEGKRVNSLSEALEMRKK